MLYCGKKYAFISHRHDQKDIINDKITNLAVYKDFSILNTPVKWIFNYKINNIASIIFDIENKHKMFNWNIYSDGDNVYLSKDMESLFEIIIKDSNQFYIKDIKAGKFLGNNKKVRSDNSYFLELIDKIDEKESEKFLFYYE